LRDDAKELGRNFQHRLGDGALNAVHALTSEVQRKAAGFLIIFANGGAGLHIIGDNARVHDSDANRVRCAGERLIRLLFIADVGVVSDVARSIGEDERRVGLEGLFHIGHDGKRVPCHADQFGAVARLESRVGNHHRDNVAHVLRFIQRHHRIRLKRRVRRVGIGDWGKAGQVAKVGEVARDIDGSNARSSASGFNVVDTEVRMPVRTA
jgi:hypothetical protein